MDASVEAATLGHATSDGNLRKNLDVDQVASSYVVPEGLLTRLQEFDCNVGLGFSNPHFFTTGLYRTKGNLYYREPNFADQCVTLYTINYQLVGETGCKVLAIRRYNESMGMAPFVARNWALSRIDDEHPEILRTCFDGIPGAMKELPLRQ